MNPKSGETHRNLRAKCYFLASYQLGSIIILAVSGVIWEKYSNDYAILLGAIVFFVLSGIAIYSLYVDSNCPQCRGNFFYKGDNPANLGFSIYTHKCTNCGFKLRKFK